MTKIIDTHTHICDSIFDDDRAEVIARARKAGIISIIAVSETLEDARRNLKLASVHPELRPAAGLYPKYSDMDQAEEMATFIRSEKDKLVAIGEVGLDFWIAKEELERELQREVFRKFISISEELGLPLNVHSRSAGKHVIALLLKENAERVHLHAFDGKASSALPAVEAGYYFSVPPSIVRSPQKQKLVKQLPLSSLMIETDSPVLGSVPKERNEPTNAVKVVEAIAEIKDVSREEVLQAAYENAVRLYRERIL